MKPKIHKIAIDVRKMVEAELLVLKNWRSSHAGSATQEIERFWDEGLWEKSHIEPVFLESVALGLRHAGEPIHSGFLYQNAWYLVEGKFTREQKTLLVMEAADNERKHFEKLANKFTSSVAREAAQPIARIPEAVRIAVWRRDEGRCADCKKRERLEFHHIVPRNKGGSSTIRNIELLCEVCNRTRGDRLDELPLSF